MKKLLFLSGLICTACVHAQNMITPFEEGEGKQSATYKEAIDFYKMLDVQFPEVKMEKVGPTDAAYSLHVVYYSSNNRFDVDEWKADGKMILLINNAIHPGEPDGIDASMMLLRDAAFGKIKVPDNIVLAVIPVFNIGGALNRNSHSRANQNGPEAYGFRGNGQNLDLNRDFIKMDAKETQSLVQLFHYLDPDLFIDNHVSDGADYQHIMTLLSTQYNKLGGAMGNYLHESFEPMIYADMQRKGYDLVPYVNHWGHTPDKGWTAFYEGPRFASGFAALFQTYSFVPETHMLKPFKQRVEATYALMRTFIKLASQHASEIKYTRLQDRRTIRKEKQLPVDWVCDTSITTPVNFEGYAAGYKPSDISGKPRLYYDRDKPFSKMVPIRNNYACKKQVDVPEAYILQHAWHKVIKRLQMNGVKMYKLERDSTLNLTVCYIDNYETVPKPYEGHYLHSNVKVRMQKQQIQLLKGDYIIPTAQKARRYIVETLEPTAPDAFFAWGFFDAILQQKEGYSDYVFEDEAAALLKNDPALRKELEQKRKTDPEFSKDGEAQLDFVYKHSYYYEPVHMRYPVFMIE